MTILITAATGRTSTYVIKALLSDKAIEPSQLRLLVRSQAAIERVKAKFPELQPSCFVIGDYLEASSLPPALEGVDLVFYNGPPFTPLETAMGIAMIEAAKNAGVKHFVFCSVLHPLLTKLLNHRSKLYVEEHLIESGLNYTILQPTSLMQNFDLQNVIKSSVIPAPYSSKTLQGFLDLEDLAVVARDVILNPTLHNRARYELVGENITLEEVAKTIGRVANLPALKCEEVPRAKVAESGAIPTKALSEYAKEGLDRMLYYYDRRGIPGNNNVARYFVPSKLCRSFVDQFP
ncbi:unnamed protein product [Somion occarium]|uniref:NmrA-like domain-containing protein n=1 Tax=Somion occarium TaxID=3059160 RepID=A0ABP1DQM0_9APHY